MAFVRLDRENCIGCGACESVCPEFWEMGHDGKTKLKNGKEIKEKPEWFELEIEENDIDCNKEAEGACPVNVIHVVD